MASNMGEERSQPCIPRDQQSTSISEEEFRDHLIQYFRTGAGDAVVDRCKDQSVLILRSVTDIGPYLHSDELIDFYVEVLFSVLEIFPFTSNDAVRSLLGQYALRKLRKCSALRMSSALQDFLESPYEESFSIDIFPHPSLFRDLEATQRLLRYGSRFEITSDNMPHYLLSLFTVLTTKLFPFFFEDVMLHSEAFDLVYGTYEKQRRLYYVLMTLNAVLRNQERMPFPKNQSHIQSLKLLFKTIPEPLITVSEISRFLSLTIAGETKESGIEEFCKEFVKEFPSGADPLGPRSLKHLSRCRVREFMAKSRNLPHGVWYLDIPTTLKNYLLVQNSEEEFYPKYVLALSSSKPSFADLSFTNRL